MAINKNHEFEDLDGVKCAVVERNISPERVSFLKNLLEFNNYTVVVVASPPPKAAAKPAAPAAPAPAPAADGTAAPAPPAPPPVAETPPPPPAPELFTLGVTDVTFNATNAIFGRLLHTRDRHVVTLAYWKQQETVAHDEVPYFQSNKS